MASNRRTLRSHTTTPQPPTTIFSPVTFTTPISSPSSPPIQIIPPSSLLPDLPAPALRLLRQKQCLLATSASSTLASLSSSPRLQSALAATLIFAQLEAGTAIYLTASGHLLTCAHCFGDTDAEFAAAPKRRWLLFYTGLAVQAECYARDPKRDLALLQIVAVEDSLPSASTSSFTHPSFRTISLSARPPRSGTPLVCIGQPGRDDLESANPDRKTGYRLLEISEGYYRGMAKGQDPHDNAEIGALMHDAWTYWGHSGAPLVEVEGGKLVGVHSSWDEGTGVRRGVGVEAVRAFLELYLPATRPEVIVID